MIVLYTGTSRELYRRDLLNVCCLPRDSYIQFGYRSKYVPPTLQPQQGIAMRNQRALIAYCEYLPQGERQFDYYPIRRAEIVNVSEDSAGAFSLTLKLDGYFNYSANSADLEAVLNQFQNYVAESIDRPPTMRAENNTGHVKRYVRRGNDWQAELFDGKWENLVEYLGRLPGLSDSVFLRPVSTTGDRFLPTLSWDVNTCRAEVRVTGGRTYEMTVRIHYGENAVHRPPEITIRGEVITACGPYLKQSSGGVEADFVLACTRGFQDEMSTLVVRVPSPEPDQSRSSELYGVATVVAPSRYWLVAILLLVVGSGLQAFGPELIAYLKSQAYSDESAKLIAAIGKILGLGLFGLGAFFGLRKLPLKGA